MYCMDLKNLKNLTIQMNCQSEKVDNFYLFSSFEADDYGIEDTVESVVKEWILGGDFAEQFWELCCEFEEDVSKAVDFAKKQGTSVRDALVATFGHFRFCYYIGEDLHYIREDCQNEKEIIYNTPECEDAVFDLLEQLA